MLSLITDPAQDEEGSEDRLQQQILCPFRKAPDRVFQLPMREGKHIL